MANKEWLSKGADGLQFYERLGDLIANARTTATAVSSATGISQSALSEYISGKKDEDGNVVYRAPDCGSLIALAKHFSVSTDYLLGLTDVKSPDSNVSKIMQYTGLTEENVSFLNNPTECINEAIHLGSEPFYSLINDMIDLCKSEDIRYFYGQLSKMYSKFKDIGAANPFDYWITWSDLDQASKRHGIATIPVADGISFYAAQLAMEIQQVFEEKYTVQERAEPFGRHKTEKVNINGKEIEITKFY